MPFVTARTVLPYGLAHIRRLSFAAAYYYCYRVRVHILTLAYAIA